MSGFRKFRNNTQRRRRSIEAVELGHLAGSMQGGVLGGPAHGGPGHNPDETRELPDQAFPASREAVEIGPAPIAWLKTKRSETEN